MKSKILEKTYKYFYLTLFFVYVLSILSSLFISLTESFSYPEFFLKHFHLPTYLIIYFAVVCGFLLSIITTDNLIKSTRWFKLIKKLFLINVKIFFALVMFALVVNTLEHITYDNFIYSKIHLQPKLLYRVIALQVLSIFVNLTLIIRAGRSKDKFILVKPVSLFEKFFLWAFHIRLNKIYRFAVSYIQDSILVIYSIVLLIFMFVGSVSFVFKFYQSDKTFLKDNELKYALRQMDIYQWVDEFFPKTKDIVRWCDQQDKPVDLVTFDPEIIWLNYEGLTRVFLTNCHYVNIYSLSKTYSYIGESDLVIASIAPCDHKSQEDKGDPKSNFYDYLKVVNNYYICHSTQIVPGIYSYKGGQLF